VSLRPRGIRRQRGFEQRYSTAAALQNNNNAAASLLSNQSAAAVWPASTPPELLRYSTPLARYRTRTNRRDESASKSQNSPHEHGTARLSLCGSHGLVTRGASALCRSASTSVETARLSESSPRHATSITGNTYRSTMWCCVVIGDSTSSCSPTVPVYQQITSPRHFSSRGTWAVVS
jgi:hypothetical protein